MKKKNPGNASLIWSLNIFDSKLHTWKLYPKSNIENKPKLCKGKGIGVIKCSVPFEECLYGSFGGFRLTISIEKANYSWNLKMFQKKFKCVYVFISDNR